MSKQETEAMGLSFQQVRVLKALRANPRGLNRKQMAELANVKGLTDQLGPMAKEDIATTESRSGKRCLLGLSYVACTVNGLGAASPVYKITERGREALTILDKSLSWPFGH